MIAERTSGLSAVFVFRTFLDGRFAPEFRKAVMSQLA